MEMQKFIGGIPMHLNYQTIGKRIRLLRKQQQLSQMTLAEMVDKSPTYISLVENGQKGPSLETLIDVANALKVTMDVLLAEYLEQNTQLFQELGRQKYEMEELQNYLRKHRLKAMVKIAAGKM